MCTSTADGMEIQAALAELGPKILQIPHAEKVVQ